MKIAFILFLAVTTLSFTQTASADPKYLMAEKALRQAEREANGFESTRIVQATGTYNQLTDHFNVANGPRFKQRYFINSSYARGAQAPVIYYLCGEATCEGADSSPYVNALAKKYGAHEVALEHRYYGYSIPFATLDPQNMRFLSMDQAIEDLAEFQRYARDGLGLKGKWIAIGGSYAGSLSAFYRLKHPELVTGSLASSAPVLAKADFVEYDRHVARVAGAACLSAIKTVVANVEQQLQNPASAAAIKAKFNASEVNNPVDFLYVLADVAAIAIQYGYQTQFCNALIAGVRNGNPVDAYAYQSNDLLTKFGITALQDSFQGSESTNPADYITVAGGRSWMWQSCTEFGYYQTANTNFAESSRSAAITLVYHNEACNRLFGLKSQVNTDNTNAKFYNGLFVKSTDHIYFTNGSNDPWSNLSITTVTPELPQNPGLQLFMISGSSHCDDLGGRVSTAITTARTQFDALVNAWLK